MNLNLMRMDVTILQTLATHLVTYMRTVDCRFLRTNKLVNVTNYPCFKVDTLGCFCVLMQEHSFVSFHLSFNKITDKNAVTQ